MGEVFENWNQGELNSYLIEITAKVLKYKDRDTGKPMVELILIRQDRRVPDAGR